MSDSRGLFHELKRRNVFRVGAAYAVVAWLLIQAADILLGNFGAPEWVFGISGQALNAFEAVHRTQM